MDNELFQAGSFLAFRQAVFSSAFSTDNKFHLFYSLYLLYRSVLRRFLGL